MVKPVKGVRGMVESRGDQYVKDPFGFKGAFFQNGLWLAKFTEKMNCA